MQPIVPTVAQQSGLDARAFFYIVLLIILCIVGFIIIMSVKRRIFNDTNEQDQSTATLMESLEHMRRSGEISQAEYDQTRRTIIEKTRAMLERDADAPEMPPKG
ncbi:MAG: hypothetical protein CMJ35_06900 [Phycisphaerae bacterium]|nr:hypothetical protein [Phycisphaerae bacterium]MBM91328.1 hypothetical protein [Phycisphaerae bacterium]HCT45907.1 hypothetical protein [Phycisphaerales bacterium]|tara:strand:- start:64 stop:375 length:312 start_codon:yes stop_codon:yes gene_type:complete